MEKVLRSIQSKIFWGGNDLEKRIARVKWDDMCKEKKAGGLGFKDLLAFNRALLGKWVWRFLNENDCLWVKVVRSRFGELNWSRQGECRTNCRRRGGWWNAVISSVSGQDGDWFWESLVQVLGDGMTADFWDGLWSGEQPLKSIFNLLFQLSTKKDKKVGEMGSWENGRWKREMGWRRELRDREKVWEGDLLQFLQNFSITEGARDAWKGGGQSSGQYSVKTAYKEII